MISRELKRAVTQAIDTPFLAALAADLTPVAATGSFLGDVEAMLASIGPGPDSRLVLIVSPSVAASLALTPAASGSSDRAFGELDAVGGGTVAGIRIIPSPNLPTSGSPVTASAILIDASRIVVADAGLELATATHASVEMSDSPTQSGATGSPLAPVGSETISLWQNNLRGIKVERRIGYHRTERAAIAVMEAAAW